MMTPEQQKLLDWFDATFAQRTAAVENNTARIDWIDEGTRVSWSEIAMKAVEFGDLRDIVTLRRWWEEVRGKNRGRI
jgi:urocanate hydratase